MFQIRNIKISLKLDCLDYSLLKGFLKNVSVYNNFLVLKDKYTYILFKPKDKESISHLNITKIPNFSAINESVENGIEFFGGKIIPDSIKIDNITATHYLNRPVSLSKLYSEFSSKVKLGYNNDVFPGLHYKTSQGTAVIFHSGKIIIVGCKTEEQILKIIKTVEKWIA